MITILDYGAGNLRSVQNTLAELGAPFQVIDQASGIAKATKLILPGVGHFGQMMRALDAMNARQPLIDLIRRGTPFLGICLGLQALFASSEEAPGVDGLGIFDGIVRRFSSELRVPHIGWNRVLLRRESKLLAGAGAEPYVYFANSFYCPLANEAAAISHYGLDFTAVLEHDNVYGVQFHPEKSGPTGLRIVRNFVNL
jgi:imidazole glycerol phosphate synthase glutamine amidotransferase subunit